MDILESIFDSLCDKGYLQTPEGEVLDMLTTYTFFSFGLCRKGPFKCRKRPMQQPESKLAIWRACSTLSTIVQAHPSLEGRGLSQGLSHRRSLSVEWMVGFSDRWSRSENGHTTSCIHADPLPYLWVWYTCAAVFHNIHFLALHPLLLSAISREKS